MELVQTPTLTLAALATALQVDPGGGGGGGGGGRGGALLELDGCSIDAVVAHHQSQRQRGMLNLEENRRLKHLR